MAERVEHLDENGKFVTGMRQFARKDWTTPGPSDQSWSAVEDTLKLAGWDKARPVFAALNTANGEVYHLCQQRHRHQEWLKFLRLIDQTVPADKQLHIICDNYGTQA